MLKTYFYVYHFSPTCFGVCYIHHLQRESRITCTKLLAFYKVFLMLHWLCHGIQNINLNDLYSSPNVVRVIKSRRMMMGCACGAYGEERGVYRVLVGKPGGKEPLGRPRRRWVDNIRMNLQEVGCGYMDWIGLAQDRDRWRTLVSAVMNLRVL